jgi:agmatinase
MATRSNYLKPRTPFYGTKAAATPKGAQLAVFGARHGTPYRGINNNVHQKAADAFRAALKFDSAWSGHWDFDFGGPLLPDENFKAVDLGDLKTKSRDGKINRKRIADATRSILEAGAVPVMFGGDDSVPIPFLEAFSGQPPITVIQLDAHIDWRDEREKERFGFSSTMRRASEMGHVWRMVQVGARGLGSAREGEVNAARNWGSRIVTAKDVRREGIEAVLPHIEPGSDCVICLDLDVLDSAVMPAVAAPSPGGLNYNQVTDLIGAIAARANLAGFCMVEFVPARDLTGTCAYTAGRISAHVIARVARRGQK